MSIMVHSSVVTTAKIHLAKKVEIGETGNPAGSANGLGRH
jgi:hypothetical protein